MVNICIIHYNTPKLTECLIRSINKFTPDSRIYIFDNSDKEPFTYRQNNIVYMDNTKGQIIDFDKWLEKFPNKSKTSERANNFGSAKHCYSVQKCINIIGKDFILIDSDVLIKKDISNIIDQSCVCCGYVENRWGDFKERFAPYLCYINVPLCKSLGISYFNKEKIIGLSPNIPKSIYDTGAYFYESCSPHQYKTFNYHTYIEHYRGGSWIENFDKQRKSYHKSTAMEWLGRNSSLFLSEKIIVTLTTWKDRICNIPTVLDTIFAQTIPPYKIVINLSKEEFGDYMNLPQDFKDYVENHGIIEINWIEGNTKQWKKIIPTLFKYPEDCVICIDDDRLYPENFIECLWNTHLKYPFSPITENKKYRLKSKYLQHAGHGTLDKLEYYNGFQGINLQNLYGFASSDTFFTLIATNSGHPIIAYEGNMGKITMYNEVSPLKTSQNTCGFLTHNQMYDYLINENIISIDNLNPTAQKTEEKTPSIIFDGKKFHHKTDREKNTTREVLKYFLK